MFFSCFFFLTTTHPYFLIYLLSDDLIRLHCWNYKQPMYVWPEVGIMEKDIFSQRPFTRFPMRRRRVYVSFVNGHYCLTMRSKEKKTGSKRNRKWLQWEGKIKYLATKKMRNEERLKRKQNTTRKRKKEMKTRMTVKIKIRIIISKKEKEMKMAIWEKK